MSSGLDEFLGLFEQDPPADQEATQQAVNALMLGDPSEAEIEHAGQAFVASSNGKALTQILEALTKTSSIGKADAALALLMRQLIKRGVVHQRVFMLFVISQMNLGRADDQDTKDIVFAALEVIDPKRAMLPIFDYFAKDRAFLRRCALYLLDNEETETCAALVDRHRKLGADLNRRLLEQGHGVATEQEVKETSVSILKTVAQQAEGRDDFDKAMSSLAMLALQDCKDVDIPKRFFALVEHTGKRYFAEHWARMFGERSKDLLRQAPDGLNLEEPEQRINLLIPISNIGDMSAYVAFLPAMAKHYGARINAIIPDSRTNREVAALFADDTVQFYLTDRGWMMAVWRPFLETLPFEPGCFGAFWTAARPGGMYSQGSWDHRFDHVRNLLALPPDVRWTQTGRWRELGSLADKVDPAYLADAVVVAPYSNSLRDRIGKHTPYCVADLDNMWLVLIDELLRQGRNVVVNGRNQEDIIRLNDPRVMLADLTLSEMLQAIEISGHFIAERSGLLDLVAASDVRGDVSVLFPKGFIYGGQISDRQFEMVAFDLDPAQVKEEVAPWVRRKFPKPRRGAAKAAAAQVAQLQEP